MSDNRSAITAEEKCQIEKNRLGKEREKLEAEKRKLEAERDRIIKQGEKGNKFDSNNDASNRCENERIFLNLLEFA